MTDSSNGYKVSSRMMKGPKVLHYNNNNTTHLEESIEFSVGSSMNDSIGALSDTNMMDTTPTSVEKGKIGRSSDAFTTLGARPSIRQSAKMMMSVSLLDTSSRDLRAEDIVDHLNNNNNHDNNNAINNNNLLQNPSLSNTYHGNSGHGNSGHGIKGRGRGPSFRTNIFASSVTSLENYDLPPSLSVTYLINWRDPHKGVIRNTSGIALAMGGTGGTGNANSSTPAAASPDDMEDHTVSCALKSCGIQIHNMDSLKDRRVAYTKMSDPRFWQLHYPLHPNATRVKNWMQLHSKFRSSAKDLFQIMNQDSPISGTVPVDPRRVLSEFQKLHKKVADHMEFEDTQLFPFFIGENIVTRQQPAGGGFAAFPFAITFHTLQTLQEQHATFHRLAYGVTNKLQKQIAIGEVTSVDDESRAALQTYLDDFFDHLDIEERTLLGVWLNLEETSYKKYRSNYLSWKYSFTY